MAVLQLGQDRTLAELGTLAFCLRPLLSKQEGSDLVLPGPAGCTGFWQPESVCPLS